MAFPWLRIWELKAERNPASPSSDFRSLTPSTRELRAGGRAGASCIQRRLLGRGPERSPTRRASLAFPVYGIDRGGGPRSFSSSFPFSCQGERGLDGFPGKPGETGEQVGGLGAGGLRTVGGQGRWGPGTKPGGLGLPPARLGASGGQVTSPAYSLCESGGSPGDTTRHVPSNLRDTTCDHECKGHVRTLRVRYSQQPCPRESETPKNPRAE